MSFTGFYKLESHAPLKIHQDFLNQIFNLHLQSPQRLT